jgi:UDP-N-acetylmuramoyl-L-alanyl-D-glutamate--2,6-diaminopimelate ligase
LVAGKGHENYQEINGVKHNFLDKEVIINLFNELEL